MESSKNCLVILGPTASGKTSLAVRLAHRFRGEILSVDSRQVYRGLDLASGKDLAEYTLPDGIRIPHHLIDIVDPATEYSLFHFQKDFHQAFRAAAGRGSLPIAVGGTGLYLESVLANYELPEAPEDPVLREELTTLSDGQLEDRLRRLKPDLHNLTDLGSRDRTIRAIEIAERSRTGDSPLRENLPLADLHPLILGVEWPVDRLNERIAARLRARLDAGMVEEIRNLHDRGVSWTSLESLGLECRFISQFLQGEIRNSNDLFQKLAAAIRQFAKRQRTWFRRMERRGTHIHWIPEGRFDAALEAVEGVQWIDDPRGRESGGPPGGD